MLNKFKDSSMDIMESSTRSRGKSRQTDQGLRGLSAAIVEQLESLSMSCSIYVSPLFSNKLLRIITKVKLLVSFVGSFFID